MFKRMDWKDKHGRWQREEIIFDIAVLTFIAVFVWWLV